METTTEQVPTTPPNPTGKGGFGDNPQNRNPGGWKKENTISYQYRRYMAMSKQEFEEAADEEGMTIAMEIAYKRVKEANKGVTGLADTKEVTDRTEGKAPQKIDITTNDESLNLFGNLSVEELKRIANT